MKSFFFVFCRVGPAQPRVDDFFLASVMSSEATWQVFVSNNMALL